MANGLNCKDWVRLIFFLFFFKLKIWFGVEVETFGVESISSIRKSGSRLNSIVFLKLL